MLLILKQFRMVRRDSIDTGAGASSRSFFVDCPFIILTSYLTLALDAAISRIMSWDFKPGLVYGHIKMFVNN